VSFTLFRIGRIFENIFQGMCFLNFWRVCLKHFLLPEEQTRYYDKCQYVFYKIADMLVEFQSKAIILHRSLRNIQILNLMIIWCMRSEVLLSERQYWRSKFSQFLILRTRLKFWSGFLVSFLRSCKKILTFAFN
jgi:hypothetical protein